MARKSYENCDCCEGKRSIDSVWLDCIECDYNKSEDELAEDAYWAKYDLDEAEMKGN